MTQETNQTKQFDELHRTFLQDVVRPYDSRLRGNYFIHQFRFNTDGKGIDYDSGGIELARKGLTLVTSAAGLYADEFNGMGKFLNEQYHKTLEEDVRSPAHKNARNQLHFLNDFKSALKNLSTTEKIMPNAWAYIDLYPAIATFKQISPESYRQGMGEMIIHQLRLENMYGLSDNDPLQFSGLDKVLQMMPNPRFLGEKYSLVGEGLVIEVLSSKEGCREIKEAEEAIKKYELIELAKRKPRINKLLKAVEKIREEELKYTHEKAELTRLLELREKQYISDRKKVLSSISAEMHLYDYRD